MTGDRDPLFGEAAEAPFDALRARILQLEQEAQVDRYCRAFIRIQRDSASDEAWRF
jgi:hypothetical protein